MNEIMKTLTIVSAIFIPLTFIAGSTEWIFSICQNFNIKMAITLL
jgi:hypothetical protein